MHASDQEATRPVTVLVADGQPLVGEALGVALSRSRRLRLLDEHPRRGPDVVAAVEHLRPDVAVLDHQLQLMQGHALVGAVRERAPRTKVIVLSALHSVAQIRQILGAGAVAFLPKNASLAQVEEAILRAHDGDSLVFREQLERHIGRLEGWSRTVDEKTKQLRSLSPRELQVLRFMASGLVVDQIAKELGVSSGTVRKHVKAILAKTHSQSQIEALGYAREAGFIG